jgi:hypothetical protein
MSQSKEEYLKLKEMTKINKEIVNRLLRIDLLIIEMVKKIKTKE